MNFSCSCGNGTVKVNNLPQSACITDYCYDVDCKKGVCQVSSNDYNCICEYVACIGNVTSLLKLGEVNDRIRFLIHTS